jgi:hypothetical protein
MLEDKDGRKDQFGEIILYTNSGRRIPQFYQREYTRREQVLYWLTFPIFVWRLYKYTQLSRQSDKWQKYDDPTIIRPTGKLRNIDDSWVGFDRTTSDPEH